VPAASFGPRGPGRGGAGGTSPPRGSCSKRRQFDCGRPRRPAFRPTYRSRTRAVTAGVGVAHLDCGSAGHLHALGALDLPAFDLAPGGVAGGGVRPTSEARKEARTRRSHFCPPLPPPLSGGAGERYVGGRSLPDVLVGMLAGGDPAQRGHALIDHYRCSLALFQWAFCGGVGKFSGSNPGLNPVVTRSGFRRSLSRTQTVRHSKCLFRVGRH
jgi:hypothetical protein